MNYNLPDRQPDHPDQVIAEAVSLSAVPEQKLRQLYDHTRRSPPGPALEIGCYRGGSTLMIALARAVYQPTETVYVCDTFQGLQDVDPERDNFHKNGDFNDTSLEAVKTMIETRGFTNCQFLPGYFPQDQGPELEQLKFSTVHIDVDTYTSYKQILEWLETRMLPGGRIVLDDYGVSTCAGATQAVREWYMKPGIQEQFWAQALHTANDVSGSAWIERKWE